MFPCGALGNLRSEGPDMIKVHNEKSNGVSMMQTG